MYTPFRLIAVAILLTQFGLQYAWGGGVQTLPQGTVTRTESYVIREDGTRVRVQDIQRRPLGAGDPDFVQRSPGTTKPADAGQATTTNNNAQAKEGAAQNGEQAKEGLVDSFNTAATASAAIACAPLQDGQPNTVCQAEAKKIAGEQNTMGTISKAGTLAAAAGVAAVAVAQMKKTGTNDVEDMKSIAKIQELGGTVIAADGVKDLVLAGVGQFRTGSDIKKLTAEGTDTSAAMTANRTAVLKHAGFGVVKTAAGIMLKKNAEQMRKSATNMESSLPGSDPVAAVAAPLDCPLGTRPVIAQDGTATRCVDDEETTLASSAGASIAAPEPKAVQVADAKKSVLGLSTGGAVDLDAFLNTPSSRP